MADFIAIDPMSFAGRVNISDDGARPFSTEERAHLLDAWGILNENLDLLEWAACRVMGPSYGPCVVRRVTNEDVWYPVTLKLRTRADGDESCRDWYTIEKWEAFLENESVDLGAAMNASWDPSGGHIHICDNGFWRTIIAFSCSGYGPDRLDAALHTASLLAHELTHVCAFGGDDTPAKEGECYNSYMIQGVFLYALATRYAEAVLDRSVAGNCWWKGPSAITEFFWGGSFSNVVLINGVCLNGLGDSLQDWATAGSVGLSNARADALLAAPCG